MTEPAVEVQAKLNVDEAKAASQSLGQQILSSITPTIDVANVAAKAVGFLKDSLVSAFESVKESIDAALEAEAAQAKFASALRLSGDVTGATLGRLQAYNTELSRKIGIDDDDLAGIQTKLIALGVEKDQLESATKATLGYAEATGKDALAATKQVAKAFEEGGEKAERMEAMFSIAEARAETLSGTFQRIGVQSSELSEDFGALIISNGDVGKTAKNAADTIEFLREKLKEAKGPISDVAGETAKTADLFSSLVTIGAAVIPEFVGQIAAHFPGATAIVRNLGDGYAFLRDMANEAAEKIRAPVLAAAKEAEFAAKILTLAGDAPQSGPRYPGDEESEKEIAATNKRRAKEATEGLRNPAKGTRVGGESDEQKAAAKKAEQEYRDIAAEGAAAQKELDDQEKKIKQAKIEAETEFNNLLKADFDDKLRIQQHYEDRRKAATERVANTRAKELEVEEKSWDKMRRAFSQNIHDVNDALFAGLGTIQDGLGGFFTGLAAAIGAGEEIDVGHMFGKMLTQMGASAIALGTAAVAGGAVGSVVPFLAPVTGGPAGIGAGAGLIAAGALAVGLGSAMGGGGESAPAPSSGAGSPGGGARVGRSSAPPDVPRGFSRDDGSEGGRTTIINVGLGRGFVHGTPRQIGTELASMIEAARGLSGRRT